MRIVAGTNKGRKLFSPKGQSIRPTSDRVRQSLFDLLGSISGYKVLDLFAGSGALGLEAISRGAESVTYFDKSIQAIELVKRNIDLLGCANHCMLKRMDALRGLKLCQKSKQKFDLVFIDPPYKSGEIEKILKSNILPPLLESHAKVVLEVAGDDPPNLLEDGYIVNDRRQYGGTLLLFLNFEPEQI